MNNSSPSIEVFLQPPSPTMNSCKLPSVKSLFPINDEHDQQQNQQLLPSIRLTRDRNDDRTKLNIIEPTIDSSSLSTSPMSPYQSSPIMTFSSPSSTTSSFCGSPLISPTQDGPFLLPPPDANTRRCRSVSNASQTSSPSTSPYCTSFTFRSLSEPPTLNLPPSNNEEDEGTTPTQEDYHHPIFGPKRKRGRPPNASRPEVKNGSSWTFIKPTVWDVKQQQQQQQHQHQHQHQHLQHQHHHSSLPDSSQNNTPQFLTETTAVMADGINTFTSTNMDMALSIPKKKRGRKPKKQMAGNSCFVWRDLTAPRGANKKSLLSKNNNINDSATTTASKTAGSNKDTGNGTSRTLLPAKKTDL